MSAIRVSISGLVFPFTLLVATTLIVSGCGESEQVTSSPASSAQGSLAPAITISTTNVSQRTLAKTVTTTGAVFAQKTTDIGPLVDGTIESVFVQVGDRVEKGDPLFRTRPDNYQISFKEHESGLALAESELENARRELERSQTLRSEGVISQNRLDNAQTQFEVARAKFGMARASFDRAKQDLEDTLVRAPFRGTITRRDIDEGTYMSSRSMGPSSGSSVVQIQAIDTVSIVVLVPELDVANVKLNARAQIFIDGIDQTINAKVDAINDRIDTESRSFEVRFYVKNPNYVIKPGLFARAEIQTPVREIAVIDRSAVLGLQNDRHVFVNDNGTAKRVTVTTRDLTLDILELVSGLDVGDEVLVGPNLGRLYDGAPIEFGAY